MKKILSIVGISLVVVIVVVLLFLGHIIKVGIETAGPKIAGVPMSVEKVRVNPFAGNVHVKALVIGNPEGFKSPSLMELGEFKLDISIPSLFTDTILIKHILISEPQITYEKTLRSSNLAELQKSLAPEEDSEAVVKEEAPKEKKAPAKKVVIEDFQFNGAKVNVVVLGKVIPIPLPPINMKDIGKDSGGAKPTEVISDLFSAISKGVVDAVASSGDIAGDALKGAGGAAGDAVKNLGGAAGDAADSIKKGIGGLFGK
jgi:hypothetical protein